MLIFTIIMKKAFPPKIIFLILYFCFLSFSKVSGQIGPPVCNACGSINSKPLCNGSQIPKCPTGKGNPECRFIGEVCTAICVNGNSADPDADFCEGSTISSSSGSLSSSGEIPISPSSSGILNTLVLNPNFAGVWKGKDLRPNVNPNSLIGCSEIQNCSKNNLVCKQGEILFPTICTKCARCLKASKTLTLNLCVIDGQLKGTITHPEVLTDLTIISQTIFTDNVVLLNLKDKDGGFSTLTLQLTGNKRLSGTFSYGISFDGRKIISQSNCF